MGFGWLGFYWVKTEPTADLGIKDYLIVETLVMQHAKFISLPFNPVCWILILQSSSIRPHNWIKTITSYETSRQDRDSFSHLLFK